MKVSRVISGVRGGKLSLMDVMQGVSTIDGMCVSMKRRNSACVMTEILFSITGNAGNVPLIVKN